MREIKFRGRAAISSKDWEYGLLTVKKLRSGETMLAIRTDNGKVIPVREDSIGEWTGCVDAHGTEIYEGDIIQFKQTDFKSEVVFRNGAFGIPHRNKVFFTLDMIIFSKLEMHVVGSAK